MKNRRSFFGVVAALVAAAACRPAVAYETLNLQRGTITFLPRGTKVKRAIENDGRLLVQCIAPEVTVTDVIRFAEASGKTNTHRIGNYRPGMLRFMGASGNVTPGTPTHLCLEYQINPCLIAG